MGKEQVLVRSNQTGQTRLISPSLSQLLFSCGHFDSLDGHATRHCREVQQRNIEHLANRHSTIGRLLRWVVTRTTGASVELPIRKAELDSVVRELVAFAEDGFLISDTDIRTYFGKLRDQEKASPARITSVGIPTRNRTDSLHRCLASYITNNQRFGREVRYLVADNSEHPGTQQRNAEAIETLRQCYDVGIDYTNRTQRAEYADVLAQAAGIPTSVTRFALLGDARCTHSYGACRNALLLHTVGLVSLQVDDDTICDVFVSPSLQSGLSLASRNLSEFWFFNDSREATAFASGKEEDFLGIHERLLGKTLGQCAASLEVDTHLHVENISSEFLQRMHGGEAKVAVSFGGTVGDTGMQSYLARLFFKGDSHKRLTASLEDYRRNLKTRQILKIPASPTIATGGSCMTINIGLDHRSLLPPFMPVMRNEDGVFGSLLHSCFQQSYRGYLPYGIAHCPPEARSHQSGSGLEHVADFRVNDLLQGLLFSQGAQLFPKDSARNLRATGHFLESIGSMPLSVFEDLVRMQCCTMLNMQIAQAERRLEEEHKAPPYWTQDMQTYIGALQQAAIGTGFYLPSDLDGNAQDRMALFQDLVRLFGTLCVYWPDIVQAAQHN